MSDARQKHGQTAWNGPALISSALKLLITVGLIAFCLSIADLGETSDALAAIDPTLLVFAFILATVGTIVLPALVTRIALLSDRIDLSLREIIAINLATRFYVIILPRVVSMGIRWFRYGRGRLSADALALMAFERVVQLVTILLFSLFAVMLEYSRIAIGADAILLVNSLGVMVGLSILAPFLLPSAARIAISVIAAWSRFLPEKLAEKSRGLTEAVTAFQHMPHKLTINVFGLSAVSFFCFISSAFVISRAMELDISLLGLVWVRSLVFILALVPIAVAGVGLREIGFIGLLATYGISAADAIAFSLLNFSLQLAIAALGAFLELSRVLRSMLFKSQKSSIRGNEEQ